MKKTKSLLILLLSVLFILPLSAQRVDTVEVYSAKMQKSIKNVVILPDGYDNSKKYPVVYLLHGHGGRYDGWIKKTKKTLPQDASKLGVIIVCPDGENSWYWDSPINPKSQFETYVSKELVAHIDKNYSTINSSEGRAITGFSMGGHGGLWLGINHPDVFGACGSMSGGVDIRPYPQKWHMKDHLGAYKDNKDRWEEHTIIGVLDKIEPNTIKIIIDCGHSDFFYQINENLHQEMLYRNIEHDYIVRPGAHTHDYWNNAVDYQLLFFSKFFNKN